MLKRVLPLFVVALVLLTSCGTLSQNTIVSTVSVSAEATITAKPDQASFTLSADAIRDTTEEARQASSEMVAKAVQMMKEEFGIEDKDIHTNYMNISPYYEWREGGRVLVGQEVNQSLRITLTDKLDDAGRVYDRLSALDGISVSSVSYSKKDISEEKTKARIQAVENAKSKAEAYASGMGMKVGTCLSLSDGTVSNETVRYKTNMVYAEAAMATMDAGYVSTTYYANDISVSDSVSAVFELVK